MIVVDPVRGSREWAEEQIRLAKRARGVISVKRVNLLLAANGWPKVREIKMRLVDAGEFPDGRSAVHFKCLRCGHDDGWTAVDSLHDVHREPCPHCNPALSARVK